MGTSTAWTLPVAAKPDRPCHSLCQLPTAREAHWTLWPKVSGALVQQSSPLRCDWMSWVGRESNGGNEGDEKGLFQWSRNRF